MVAVRRLQRSYRALRARRFEHRVAHHLSTLQQAEAAASDDRGGREPPALACTACAAAALEAAPLEGRATAADIVRQLCVRFGPARTRQKLGMGRSAAAHCAGELADRVDALLSLAPCVATNPPTG